MPTKAERRAQMRQRLFDRRRDRAAATAVVDEPDSVFAPPELVAEPQSAVSESTGGVNEPLRTPNVMKAEAVIPDQFNVRIPGDPVGESPAEKEQARRKAKLLEKSKPTKLQEQLMLSQRNAGSMFLKMMVAYNQWKPLLDVAKATPEGIRTFKRANKELLGTWLLPSLTRAWAGPAQRFETFGSERRKELGIADDFPMPRAMWLRTKAAWDGRLKVDDRTYTNMLFGVGEMQHMDSLKIGGKFQPNMTDGKLRDFAQIYPYAGILAWPLAWAQRANEAKAIRENRHYPGFDPRISVGNLIDEGFNVLSDPTTPLIIMPPSWLASVARLGPTALRPLLRSQWGVQLGRPVKGLGKNLRGLGGDLFGEALDPINAFGENSLVSKLILQTAGALERATHRHVGLMDAWLKGNTRLLTTTQQVMRRFRTGGFKTIDELGQQGGTLTPFGSTSSQVLDAVRVQGGPRYAARVNKATFNTPPSGTRSHQLMDAEGKVRRFVVQDGQTPSADDIIRALDETFQLPKGPERSIKAALHEGREIPDINALIAAKAKSAGWSARDVNRGWAAARQAGLVSGRGRKPSMIQTGGVGPKAKEVGLRIREGSELSGRMGALFHGRLTASSFTPDELAHARTIRELIREELIKPNLHLTTKVRKDGKWVNEKVFDPRVLEGERFDIFKDMAPKLFDPGNHIPTDVAGIAAPKFIRDIWFPKLAKKAAPGMRTQPVNQFDMVESMRGFISLTNRKAHVEPTLKRLATKKFQQDLQPWQKAYLENWTKIQSGKWQSPLVDRFDSIMARRFVAPMHNKVPGWAKRGLGFMEHLTTGGKPVLYRRRYKYYGMESFRMADTQRQAMMIQHNIFRNLLGFAGSSAFQNSTIVQNVATKHGVYSTGRAMTNMLGQSRAALGLREMRDNAQLLGQWTGIYGDDVWKRAFGDTYDKFAFFMFNMTEAGGKGVAFNAAVENMVGGLLKAKAPGLRGAKNFGEFFDRADAGLKTKVMQHGYEQAAFMTHFYGQLASAPAFHNPFVRPFYALQSFAPKQIGFLARRWQEDPSQILRYWSLSGFLVDQLDRQFGIDGSAFTGLGFTPMMRGLDGVPLLDTPAGGTILGLLQTMGYASAGDYGKALKSIGNVRERMPTVVSAGELGASFPAFGLTGMPVRTIRNLWRAYDGFTRGERRDPVDDSFRREPPETAIMRFLVAPPSDARFARETLREIQQTSDQIGFVLDQRADKYWLDMRRGVYSGDEMAGVIGDLHGSVPGLPGGRTLNPADMDPETLENWFRMVEDRIWGRIEKNAISKDDRRWGNMSDVTKMMWRDEFEVIRKLGAR